MGNPASERAAVEAYLEEHGLEATLNDAVNEVVRIRPADPYLDLGSRLLASSEAANRVLGVGFCEVLDGRGRRCLEVTVETQRGRFTAAVPGEAPEEGLSALREAVEEADVTDQRSLDAKLASTTAAPARAILACSMACCKAGARHKGLEVYEHLADLCGETPSIPTPCVAIASGGRDAERPSQPFAEIALVPRASSLDEALATALRVNARLPEKAGGSPYVGRRGAYEIPGKSPGEVLDVLVAAIADDCDVQFALAAAASTFAERTDDAVLYDLSKFGDSEPRNVVEATGLVELYVALLAAYPICTLEDPFWAEDVPALLLLKDKLDLAALRASGRIHDAEDDGAKSGGKNDNAVELDLKPVGGDASCTLQLAGNAVCRAPDDVDVYEEQKTVNTLCISPFKGKTTSGCLDLASKARAAGWGIVVVDEDDDNGGETGEIFVAHLAVGVRAGLVKGGGLNRPTPVYSELLRIAAREDAPPFIGPDFRAAAM